MNILSMAFKNLRNNFSFYALYLFSVSLVITVFFAFTSFSMNTVMLENIFVCCGAFFVGLFLGAIAHKGIVIGITALLNLTVESSQISLFNMNAIVKTVRFILLVVFVLCVSNGGFLFKTSLMKLIRFPLSTMANVF